MKNRTLKLFSDKNKGKLKKSLAIGLGAGAGLGTALGSNYLINKEASDKLNNVSDDIKNIEGLTDSQRINMQKKLNDLSDAYRDGNASYDRALGNTEIERKLLENQFKTKAISQEEYNKRLGDLFLKDNQARIDHQINPEDQMKKVMDVYNNPDKTPVTVKDKLADFLGTYGENDKLGLGNYEGFSDKKLSNKKKLALAGLGAVGAAGLGTLGVSELQYREAANRLKDLGMSNEDIKDLNKLKVPQSYKTTVLNKVADEIEPVKEYADSKGGWENMNPLEKAALLGKSIKGLSNSADIIYDVESNIKPVTLKDKALDLVGLYGKGDKPGMGNYDVDYFRNELNKPIDNFSSSISPIYFAQKMSKAEKLKANQKIINQKAINQKDPIIDTPTIPAKSIDSIKKESSKSPRNDFEAREKDIKTSQDIDKTRLDNQSSDWAKKIAKGTASTINVIKNSGNLAKLAGTGIKNSVANKVNSVRHAIGGAKDKVVNGVKNFFTGGKSAVEQKYGRGEIDKDLVKANKSLATKQAKANSTPEKRPGFKELMSKGWQAAKTGGSGTIQKLRDHSNQSMKEIANNRQQKRNIANNQQYNLRQARRNAKTGNTGGYRQFFFSDGSPNRFALTNFAMNNPVFELEAQLIDNWNRDYNLQQMFSDYYEFEEYFITNFSDLDYYSDYLSQFEPVIDYVASMTSLTENNYFNFSNQVLNDIGDCLVLFANKDTQFTANKNKGVGTDNYGHGLYGKHDSGIHFAPETQQRIQEEGQRYFSRWSSAYVNAIGNSLGLNEQSSIQFQANSNKRMQEFLNPSSNFSAKDVAISALLPAGVAFGGTSLINAIDGQDRFDPAVSAALSGGLGLTAGIAREISNRDAERLTLQRLKEALDEKNQDKRK